MKSCGGGRAGGGGTVSNWPFWKYIRVNTRITYRWLRMKEWVFQKHAWQERILGRHIGQRPSLPPRSPNWCWAGHSSLGHLLFNRAESVRVWQALAAHKPHFLSCSKGIAQPQASLKQEDGVLHLVERELTSRWFGRASRNLIILNSTQYIQLHAYIHTHIYIYICTHMSSKKLFSTAHGDYHRKPQPDTMQKLTDE